jgi:hypothetical protein
MKQLTSRLRLQAGKSLVIPPERYSKQNDHYD